MHVQDRWETLEAVTPVAVESLLGYHPCSIGFLTSYRNPVGGQCQGGSLTGAVASERVSEALKGSLRSDEVNKYTMESMKVKGLYFAGEVLDIDANTGGYNMQIAFSTGRLAGQLKK